MTGDFNSSRGNLQMGSDWDYIQQHMGGHGEDGLPNFMKEIERDHRRALWKKTDPIIEASCEGNIEIVASLINGGADVNVKDFHGWTALMRSSYEGHKEIVKYLINCGADVNATNKYGWTALIEASYKGHIKIVELLINGGADLNVKTENGFTALMTAYRKGYNEIIKILEQAESNRLYQNQTSNNKKCPRCKKGIMIERKNRENGNLFHGCLDYPKCRYTE